MPKSAVREIRYQLNPFWVYFYLQKKNPSIFSILWFYFSYTPTNTMRTYIPKHPKKKVILTNDSQKSYTGTSDTE